MKTSREGKCHESSSRTKDCVPFARENYYFGKMLTAWGLQSEQNYLNEKRWLINRYGIGWGVLCGLKVKPHPDNLCSIIIEPGLALDQYGNEIRVCEPREVNLKQEYAKLVTDIEKTGVMGSSHTLCVSIRYKECPSQPAPIAVEDCGDLATECVFNCTIETFEIKVSYGEPKPASCWHHELDELLKCEADCLHILRNPGALIVERCPPRCKCADITLACICYTEGKPLREYNIDNIRFRKLAFSNEILFEMIRCLTKEAWEAKGTRYDRRKHVPLLAHTIKGLTYRDGKNATLSEGVGIHPHRLTSDGDTIWVTDLEAADLIRISRETNAAIDPVNLKSSDEMIEGGWGIAFDGTYMWITHNNNADGKGKLTRISTCDLRDCWTFDSLPSCDALGACQKYCHERDPRLVKAMNHILPYPQEAVYHNKLLYVSHGWPDAYAMETAAKGSATPTQEEHGTTNPTLYVSIIDTDRCCLVKTVEIQATQYSIPMTPIVSMASDGDALWVTYKARHYGMDRPVVRSLRYCPKKAEWQIGEPVGTEKGTDPGKIAFDGTYLWVTHDDGASKVDGYGGKVVQSIDTQQEQMAIAYGGGDNIWTVEVNAEDDEGEAQVNRFDIHSARGNGAVEFMRYEDKRGADYGVTDAQFDGTFIYIAAWYFDSNAGKKGIVHRVLP